MMGLFFTHLRSSIFKFVSQLQPRNANEITIDVCFDSAILYLGSSIYYIQCKVINLSHLGNSLMFHNNFVLLFELYIFQSLPN